MSSKRRQYGPFITTPWAVTCPLKSPRSSRTRWSRLPVGGAATGAASNRSPNPVTSDLGPRSFDRPRERPAPTTLTGRWSNGDDATVEVTGLTLLVVIKTNCDGCHDFLFADLAAFAGIDVLFVSATDETNDEWKDAPRPVLIAPEALLALDVRWPPFYLLVDPVAGVVRTEGVLFGPSQVAAEIASFLPR
jgi:hypothetical protein